MILLSGLVGSRVSQLAVNLEKIFERQCKSHWKVQVCTQVTHTGRPNVKKKNKKKNRFMSSHSFDWENESNKFEEICDKIQ